MQLERTDGIHSKNAKLTEAQVHRIRSEYDKGKRGKERAHRFGISAVNYNKIGKRGAWKTLVDKAK